MGTLNDFRGFDFVINLNLSYNKTYIPDKFKEEFLERKSENTMAMNMKDKFEQSNLQNDPFMKELYKKVRNNTKKLEDVTKIEQKLNSGSKITKEQQDKLNKKALYQHSVDESTEMFNLYIKNQTIKEEQAAALAEEA